MGVLAVPDLHWSLAVTLPPPPAAMVVPAFFVKQRITVMVNR